MPTKQKKRSEILEQLLQNLKTWDRTSEAASGIIKKNEFLLTELKTENLMLKQVGSELYSKEEQKQIAAIIEGQQILLTIIKQDRTAILEKMKQVNQKNKVVDNYYSSFQQSIFVDKGM
ncbi:hypothetical protein JTF06_07355 [Desemzia sp. RIT804]|uniref:hypothetical protein n=1 Tax=Desemzia sp. RIT 804 TaxID=2810209 RepID=UPI00194F4746|nr:hypothetical protein [Desemzia sp. RIT 804]MBM6614705.1 hypothetical protein [Desemzia sp. RIT 804]